MGHSAAPVTLEPLALEDRRRSGGWSPRSWWNASTGADLHPPVDPDPPAGDGPPAGLDRQLELIAQLELIRRPRQIPQRQIKPKARCRRGWPQRPGHRSSPRRRHPRRRCLARWWLTRRRTAEPRLRACLSAGDVLHNEANAGNDGSRLRTDPIPSRRAQQFEAQPDYATGCPRASPQRIRRRNERVAPHAPLPHTHHPRDRSSRSRRPACYRAQGRLPAVGRRQVSPYRA